MKKLLFVAVIMAFMGIFLVGCQNILNNENTTFSHPQITDPQNRTLYVERREFKPNYSDVTGLKGYSKPSQAATNSGKVAFTNYDETEIYYTKDVVEFVDAFFGDTNGNVTRKIFWVVYYKDANGADKSYASPSHTVSSLTAQVNWQLTVNISSKTYYMYMKDNGNGSTYNDAFVSSNSFTGYIYTFNASTELYTDVYNSFLVKDTICNTNAQRGSSWYYAGNIFYYSSASPTNKYVSTTYSCTSYITTQHQASNDPNL